MAIALVAGVASSVGSPAANNCIANVPSSQAGDISVICISANMAGAAVSAPAGWTTLFGSGVNVGSTNGCANAFWRAWQPGDPATVTLTSLNAGRWMVQPFRVRGALLSAPFPTTNHVSIGAVAATGPMNCPGVTAANPGMMLINFHSGRTTTSGVIGTWTTFSDTTELMDNSSTSGGSPNSTGLVAFKQLTDAGITGAKTARCSVAITAAGLTFLIAPAPVTAQVLKMKGGATVTTRYKGQP